MDRPSRAAGLTTAASVVIVVGALRLAQDVFIPLALAVLVSFMLAPLVTRIERVVPRVVAVLAAVLLVMSVIGGVGWLVGRRLPEITARMPEYRANLLAKVRSLRGTTAGMGKVAEELEEFGEEIAEPAPGAAPSAPAPQPVEIVTPPPSPAELLRLYLSPILGPVGTAGLVGVLAVFMLIQREDLRDRLLRLSGGSDLSLTSQAMNDAAERVSRYLLTTTFLNAIHGVVIGTGLWLIGLPTAFLFGLLSMLLRFIPYVGPWLAASLPIALSVALLEGWSPVLLTVTLFVAAELVSNNVLEPWLYGQSTGLSPFGVILAAVFWSWLWGVVGLLLAIPLTACLVVLGRYAPRFEPFRILLGDEPVLPADARLYQRLLVGDGVEASKLFESEAEEGSDQALDAVALPALAHLARDSGRGAISADEAARIRESLAEIVEEARDPDGEGRDGAPRIPGSGLRVVCAPARDEDDALAAAWLAALLAERGFEVRTPGVAELTSELVEHVASGGAEAVCISALSPGAGQRARYLAKRLRARCPELEIVVGLWGQPEVAEALRTQAAAGKGVRWTATLAEALAGLATAAEHLRPRKTGSEPG
jgi:predicted PurR-regulated permease PerM/methylmalonyl-CoA mutase cobalamin-binding subunit